MAQDLECIENLSLGSIERLKAIASSNIEEQSEAAKRCLEKRARRKDLMLLGMSFHTSCLVVNQEYGR